MNIPGFKISKNIHSGNRSNIFAAIRVHDNQPVIIKTQEDLLARKIVSYKLHHEFKIGKIFKSKHIIEYIDIKQIGNQVAIIQEYFDGVKLEEVIPSEGFTPQVFLDIALLLVEGIDDIHQQDIIHKNISLSNILINNNLNEIKIIDFGLASEFSQEPQQINQENTLYESLIFSSPEQTGRMNRMLDYRTDYYSLGVCFYQLLCGHPPFSASDSFGLIHSHIAKIPIPLNEQQSDIPIYISDCIMKLLSKNPEDRYQSTYGLKMDLEHCKRMLRTNKSEDFLIGMADQSPKFTIHRKLYGREKEIGEILDSFEDICSGVINSKLVMVCGYPGVGKSSLIRELEKPLRGNSGNFIAGKYDQFKRNIPYSSFIQAYQTLIRNILAENRKNIDKWRIKLSDALGNNAQVIIDVIPQVELIIGPQKSLPILGAEENQNRFNRVFLKFSQVFCQKDHPLVIFLDDLQWADIPTLNLIKLLVTDPEINYLFLIGAYRDDEVDETHPIIRILDEIDKKTTISNILIKPLSLNSVNSLISDSLSCKKEYSLPLAKLVFNKTLGNPFFVNMLLQDLAHERLIYFESSNKQWVWDISKIKSLAITDNVVELMISRIQKLPRSTQKALSLSACIGNQFNLKTLSLIYGKSSAVTFNDLWRAIKDGLVIPIEDEYEWVEHTDEKYHETMLQFSHDRVQQAAYSLIKEESRPKYHLQLGRLLLENWSKEEIDKNLFEIVNHLNAGKEYISDVNERRNISLLNLTSAQRAKKSSAYLPALNYITIGMEYLPDDAWDTCHELTLSYYFEKGEIEYLTAHWDTAILTFDEALSHTKTLLERCKINKYKIILYRMKNNLSASLKVGVDALCELDIPLTAFPARQDVNREITRLKALIKNKDTDKLYSLPDLNDPLKEVALEILSEVFAPAYFLGSRLTSIIGIKMTEITIEFGNSPYAAVGYIFYSAITLSVDLSDYDNAYKYGELALRINGEKYQDKANEALILDMWGTFVCHHKKSLSIASDSLLKGHHSGVENGSYQWAGYCGMIYLFTCFWGLHTLQQVSEKIASLTPGMQKIDPNMVQYYYAVKATVFNLTTTAVKPTELSEAVWPNKDKVIQASIDQDDMLTLLVTSTCRLFLANCYNDTETALLIAEDADKYAEGAPGVFINPVFRFHQCLAYCQSYDTKEPSFQSQLIKKIKPLIASLDLWAVHCPDTYFHQAMLAKAELARIQDKVVLAMKLYDDAIDSAKENGFIQNEAIANELASRFYLSLGREKIAGDYLRESCALYQLWGANEKASVLIGQNPQLFTTAPGLDSVLAKTAPLEFNSLIKSLQAISSDMKTDSLLRQLMSILMENAGAEKGCLLLAKPSGELYTVVSGNLENQKIQENDYLPLEKTPDICQEIAYLTSRTKETLVLDNACKAGSFQKNEYIVNSRVRSIACIPILYKEKLKGVIYLENNIAIGAFSVNRLEIIKIITAQAAISIENANLYRTLEDKVEARTFELQQAVKELRRSELESRESEQRLSQILKTAVDSMVVIDANGIIETFNAASEKMFGYLSQEVVGENIKMLMGDSDNKSHDRYLKDYIATGKATIIGKGREVLGKKKDGTEFWIGLAISKLILGDRTLFSGIMRDITKDIEDRITLVKAKDEADNANLAKSKFLSSMSHELRTPLNAILGFSQLLEIDSEKALGPSQRDSVNHIVQAGNHLLNLINDVLDLGKIEAGKTHISISDIRMGQIIDRCFEMIQSLAIEKNIELNKSHDNMDAIVRADKTFVKQILLNLLSNAIKYNLPGGKITVSCSVRSANTLRIEVMDNGIGIPVEKQGELFIPFSRLGHELSGLAGTGIGLSVCKGLIELMEGNIGVKSEAKIGSTFWFELPLVVNQPATSMDSASEITPKTSEPLPKLDALVLYVEDDVSNVELMERIFETIEGARLITATSAEEGIETAIAQVPDIILLDVNLPGMSGIDALAHLRHAPETAKIPVIALSGAAMQEDIDKGLSAGFKMYLTKPIQIRKLIDVLDKLMRTD